MDDDLILYIYVFVCLFYFIYNDDFDVMIQDDSSVQCLVFKVNTSVHHMVIKFNNYKQQVTASKMILCYVCWLWTFVLTTSRTYNDM